MNKLRFTKSDLINFSIKYL